MEFWGLEVQPGETVKVDPGENKYLHLSQASLGEIKKDKGNEDVLIFVKFNNKKLVLGTLSADKCAQIQYDLVFEKEFELSHGSKNTNIYFIGYKTVVGEYGDDGMPDELDSQSESDKEDHQLAQNVNAIGKSVVKDEKPKPAAEKPNAAKADALVVRPKPKTEEPKKDDKQNVDEDDDEDEDDESQEDESDDDDEDMLEGEDDSDDEDEDESSDEEEEATPKKVKTGNKRPTGSASKTPVPEKKAKLISPVGNQKTGVDGKKGGVHIATPHPAKQGKTLASKQQTPKSSGTVSCKSCSKTFNSENALQAHSKAKHSAGK